MPASSRSANGRAMAAGSRVTRRPNKYRDMNVPRSLSDSGDRSEHGGRASTEVLDIEAHSGSMQRNIGELWAALPPAQ